MKRHGFDEDHHEIDSIKLANALVLLSRSDRNPPAVSTDDQKAFECKTCSRRFASFQALGGHRASHKRPKTAAHEGEMGRALCEKPKAHECSICGVEFAIGQALGGHMRRHREKSAGNKAGPFGLKTVGNKAGLFDLNFPPLDEKFERKLGPGLRLGLGLGLEHVC